mmetsp:Transcript_11792/g.16518  ORF Transcript_11792/g.16518 Transcript_11792/m.16518 type:complete len:259 (-) Transcript_11792:135-911(-)
MSYAKGSDMSDNQLRAVLVYRLESSGATVLAKYDHASQYETHGGAEGSSLYGGRDKNYADAGALVIGNDPPGKPSEGNTLGGFKVVQSDVHQIIYGADIDGICMAVITGLSYPSRVGIAMLTELYKEFKPKFGGAAKTAATNTLSKKSKDMLKKSADKYSDLNKVDKAAALNAKVDEVKSQMGDNIAGILKNTEKAETIQAKSEQLNEQAAVFKKRSTDLKKQMKCKNLKMTLILAGLVIGILLVILIPLIKRAKSSD